MDRGKDVTNTTNIHEVLNWQQRMRWLDGIPDSMNMSLSKLGDCEGQGGLVCYMGSQSGARPSDRTVTAALKWESPKFHCLTCKDKPDPWRLSSSNLLSKTTYYQKKKTPPLYKREFRIVIGAVKNVLGVGRGSLSIKSGRLPEGEFMLNFGRGGGESQVLWSAHRLYYFREEEWGVNKWTLSALKMSLLHARW